MRTTDMLGTIGVAAALFIMPVTPVGWTDAPVADAAQRGDLETVRTLLRSGADVNVAQGDGMSALHWASELGQVPMIDVLLNAGADVRAVTRIGDLSPLHLAAKAGHAAATARLTRAGADVNAPTSSGGSTPLHYAALAGDPETVRTLLEYGADIDAREARRGQTPLMFAAARNRLDAVTTLLEHGADPSVTSRAVRLPDVQQADRTSKQVRDTVLRAFRAATAGDATSGDAPSAVQAAIQAANRMHITPEEPTEDPVDLEEQQPTALSYAQMVGRQGGMTALTYAAREGHTKTALALVAAGAQVNQVTAGDHTSPMLMAMINGHFDLGIELLEHGADPSLASDAGTTPLYAALNTHWAPKARYPQQQSYQLQQHTYLDVMRRILEAGFDPNLRLKKHLWYMGYTFDQLRVNTTGATPFWRAAYATDVAAMKLLMEHGADPNIATAKVPSRRFGRRRSGDETDHSGLPPVPTGGPAVFPIHAASGVGYGEGFAGNAHRHVPNGWFPAVQYLVEDLGADVNARDLNGYTAVHHAAARGDNDLILYLVDKGADVMVVSRRGQTTVDMANGPVQRIQPFPATVALLERLGAVNNHNCVSCE